MIQTVNYADSNPDKPYKIQKVKLVEESRSGRRLRKGEEILIITRAIFCGSCRMVV